MRRRNKKTQRNSKQRFEIIYKKLHLPISKFVASRIGADAYATEEVIARTFAAAYKSWNTFENKSSYFTWLCRIALNKIADYYRDQVNRRSRLVVPLLKEVSDLPDTSAGPEESLALTELCDAVNECLDLLTAEKRKLLHLRYWKDMTVGQIAKKLSLSERAVEGRIYRAKKSFEAVHKSRNE